MANHQTSVACLCIGLLVSACASVPIDMSEASAETGVIEHRYVVPKSNSYWNRDWAGAMGGAFGLVIVDAMYAVPEHFTYRVLLKDGRTVYVWNAADITVGTCVELMLRPWRRESNYHPLGYNSIEPSKECQAEPSTQ